MHIQEGNSRSSRIRLSIFGAIAVGLFFTFELISTGGQRLIPGAPLTPDKMYTLNISGTAGTRFCGEITIKTADGKVKQRDIDGIVPASFEVMGKSVDVTFRKCEEGGQLNVALASYDEPTQQGNTAERYGTVKLSMN